MTKISPIAKNNFFVKNIQRNKKHLWPASLLTLSLLTAMSIGSCSKLSQPLNEDVFEQTDTTKTTKDDDKKAGFDIIVDDSLNVVEHFFTI